MKVDKLISILQTLDPDAEVMLFWDGAARGGIEGIYLDDSGRVILVGDWSIYKDRIEKDYAVIY